MIGQKILNNLEYDKIIANIDRHLILSMSKDRLKNTFPAEELEEALRLQALTREAERVMYYYQRAPLENFDDCEDVIARASKLSTLSFGDLKRVGHLLKSARIFAATLADIPDEELPLIKGHVRRLYDNKAFETSIDETFISDEEIADTASADLYTIRKKIRKTNTEIKDRLNGLIRNREMQKYLQDTIVTSREGRFVVPVKSDCKGKVSGLIHDYSATGSTIYVEPIEIVEINNELRMLYLDEKAEIERIMQEFTRKVSLMSDALYVDQDTLVDMDILFAKVSYGKACKGVIPKLLTDGSFDIRRGRHPLLNGVEVVPVSVALQKKKNYILISGPNTGGKTVTMKMVGLFALMAMSGMYIPADEGSEVSFYDNVFSDIGDEQSIEQNLSTFSSHIATLKTIIDNVTSNSLVLLDEIGGGTDPEEGAALALAVLEYLIEKDSKGIITTHYSELKEYSYSTDKILNASMEFDMATLSPTYKLNVGVPGSSKALEIAMRLGVDGRIIAAARDKISPQKKAFDEIIASCEKERLEAETLKNRYEKLTREAEERIAVLNSEKDKLLKEKENATRLAKIEAKRIISDATDEAEELVSKIKEIYNKEDEVDGKDVIEASKLKNKLGNIFDEDADTDNSEAFKPFDLKKAKVGDKVFVKSFNSLCEISEIKKGEITVILGSMKFKAKSGDILTVSPKYVGLYAKSEEKPDKKKLVKKTDGAKMHLRSDVKAEINILGLRVHEAKQEVERFIDKARLGGLSEVKIIHGVGTLALKKAVEETLRSNKAVKSFRGGQFGEGDLGVTIVELKK